MAAPDTGNTATVAFGTTNFAVDITRIGSFEMDMPILNASHLGTTVNELYAQGDIVSLDPIEMDFWFDPAFGTETVKPPIATTKEAAVAPEVITITWPVQTGDSTGLILAGTGFLNHCTLSELVNNTLQAASLSVQFLGGASDPSWTNPT